MSDAIAPKSARGLVRLLLRRVASDTDPVPHVAVTPNRHDLRGKTLGVKRRPLVLHGEAVPARADDLSDLPPSFVSVGTADGFRDEALAYAMRLAEVGVPTELHMYPGLPHGFQAFTTVGLVQNAARDRLDWLRRVTR